MSEEKKRRKVTRGFGKKRRSMVAARRRAEGKSRRDVAVEEGSCNGGACIPRLPPREVAKDQVDGTKALTLSMIDAEVGADR